MHYSLHNIVIDPSVKETSFACDLSACKGACCTLPGGRGAPLLDEEIGHISSAIPIVRHSLSEHHQSALDEHGPFEGPPGDYHTTCVDDGACVFVTHDGPIALCSIEQAYHRGEISWRKPISCHLFPIRVDDGPSPYVRFEYIPACLPALRRGKEEHIPLFAFVSEAMERAFGPSWVALKERLIP